MIDTTMTLPTDTPPKAAPPRLRRFLDLDMIERIIIVALFGTMAGRFAYVAYVTNDAFPMIYVLSEGAIFVFTLIRRRTDQISTASLDWIVGILGTGLPLLVSPAEGPGLLPRTALGAIFLIGVGIQLWAKFTLRRSFGVVAANRGVVASGPYKLVRHPMYAGYFVGQVAFLMTLPGIGSILLMLAAWVFQVMRVIAEERILGEDPHYQALRETTPYRVIPGIF